MQKQLIFPAALGVIGAAILLSLCVWQVQRMAWKNGILAQIDARIVADPVALPLDLDPVADKYLPVFVKGTTGTDEILVLTSQSKQGPGFRVITSFDIDDRRVMLDRGFIRQTDVDAARPATSLVVTGNVHWPDETDSYTPAPDPASGMWFARDVDKMAAALKTEPVLIIARSSSPDSGLITPLPVTSSSISNDHLEYAITWFLMALVWVSMTAYLILRIRRKTV